MRKHLLAGAAAVLVLGSLAQAQYGPGGIYHPRSVSAIIDRVHGDLNRGYRGWHVSHGDRKRLDHAEHELRDFARKWNRGRFDRGELDDAIGSIQHVVDNNHLSGRERDALYNDLDQLRNMREAYNRHEIGYGRR